MNIILGNLSLQWIPVSFMQTVKVRPICHLGSCYFVFFYLYDYFLFHSLINRCQASVPAFTAVLTVAVLRQLLHWTVVASLIPVVGGVVLATKTEVNFDMFGFVACLLASALTGACSLVYWSACYIVCGANRRALPFVVVLLLSYLFPCRPSLTEILHTVPSDFLFAAVAGYSILSGRVLSGTNKLDSTNLVFYMSPLALMILAPGAILFELKPYVACLLCLCFLFGLPVSVCLSLYHPVLSADSIAAC